MGIMSIMSIFLFSILPQGKQPVELGKVHWYRDLKQAQHLSNQQNKPILILFQEVPGCSTCKNYGSDILSHPLVVEVIETYFIPLCIYNNTGGNDALAIKLFSEPSWNNPVVRIVDKDLRDIVLRVSGNYQMIGLLQAISNALAKSELALPEYLSLLKEEAQLRNSSTEEIFFQMYCFWSGELAIGKIPGVLSTEAGFMKGGEVVKTVFNPSFISPENLIEKAKMLHVAEKIYSSNPNLLKQPKSIQLPGPFRSDSETKYYLYNSPYKSVPMTSLQAIRINFALANHLNPQVFLSPRQLQKLPKSSSDKNLIGKDIVSSWYSN